MNKRPGFLVNGSSDIVKDEFKSSVTLTKL